MLPAAVTRMIVPCVAPFIVLSAIHLFISRSERSGITSQRTLHRSDRCEIPLLLSKERDDEGCDARDDAMKYYSR